MPFLHSSHRAHLDQRATTDGPMLGGFASRYLRRQVLRYFLNIISLVCVRGGRGPHPWSLDNSSGWSQVVQMVHIAVVWPCCSPCPSTVQRPGPATTTRKATKHLASTTLPMRPPWTFTASSHARPSDGTHARFLAFQTVGDSDPVSSRFGRNHQDRLCQPESSAPRSPLPS